MTVRDYLVSGAAVVLLVGCGSGRGSRTHEAESTTTTTASASVDSGFRPRHNGFSFANGLPTEPFDYVDAITMFGADAVCREPEGECTPRPEAVAWVEKVAAASWGGLCEGMAVMAADRWVDGEDPDTAGLPETGALTHRIMQWWATQFLGVVQEANAARSSPPRDLLDRIERAITAGGPGATISLDHHGASHTLVPYAVHRDGDMATLDVYDPNSPGEERVVTFDLAADEWSYDFPTDGPDKLPWTGRAFDIGVIDLDTRATPWSAPFLSTAALAATATVTTSGEWTIVRASADGSEAVLHPDDITVGDDGVMTLVHDALGSITVVLDPGAGLRIDTGSPVHVTLETSVGSVSASHSTISSGDTSVVTSLDIDTNDGPEITAHAGAVELATFAPDATVRAAAGVTTSVRIDTSGTAHATVDGHDVALEPTDTRLTDGALDSEGHLTWFVPRALPAEVRDGTPEPPVDVQPGDDSTTSSSVPTTDTVGPDDGSDRVTISIEFPASGSVRIVVESVVGSTIPFVPAMKGPGLDHVSGRSTMSISKVASNLQPGGEYTFTLTFDDGLVIQRTFVLP